MKESYTSQELVNVTNSALYTGGKHAAADLLGHSFLQVDEWQTIHIIQHFWRLNNGKLIFIYPPKDKICLDKEGCYLDGIEVSEMYASIRLQNVLDRIIKRLLQTLDYMISLNIMMKSVNKFAWYANINNNNYMLCYVKSY